MSKPGRKPNAIPRKHISTFLRIDLLAELDLILHDPMRDKLRYGGRTEYFEQLVEADLNKRRKHFAEQSEPSELARFVNQLKFELKHFDAGGLRRIWTLINEFEAKHGRQGDDSPGSESSGVQSNTLPDERT